MTKSFGWGGGLLSKACALREKIKTLRRFAQDQSRITCLFASIRFTCFQQRNHLFHSEDTSFRTYLQKAFRLLLLSPPNNGCRLLKYLADIFRSLCLAGISAVRLSSNGQRVSIARMPPSIKTPKKAFRLLLLSPPNSCHRSHKDQAIYLPKPLFSGHLSLILHLIPNTGP